MNCFSTEKKSTLRLPKLAAMMLVFLGLSTNTHLDAAPAWQMQSALPQPHITPQSKNAADTIRDQIHILSAHDASLYRTAFAAQEKADWQSADEALAQIKDKRLIGHILADRYLRRDLSLDEARQWMADYADLPEASPIYERAHRLRGFATAHIATPQTVASWSGHNGFTSSAGFRVSSDNDNAAPRTKIDTKVNSALRHGDPIKAREILTTELQRGTLSATDASDIVARIAAAFFYEGEIERARPMAHTAASTGAPLGLWIEGLASWKQQDYASAAHAFAALAETDGLSAWDKAAAAYWAYRANSHMGNKSQAYHWLAESAKTPHSFYGYMAANLMGHRSDRSWKMPDLNAKNLAILSQRPAGGRALALVQVGRIDLAESELRRLTPMSSRELRTATLALAEKAHMPSLTLQLSGLATNDNGQLFDAAQYPLPPWKPSSGFKVDRALMYALIRHESQFDPEAVSGRGACGLMQLMPATVRQIANDANAPRGNDCPNRMFDPATNMDVGQKYVRVLAGQPMIGDNLLLLLAAYNGGPGNLAHWLDGNDRADPLMFIESLPLRETRDYVQQVQLHYWMYRARLSQPETAVTQLAHGEWPRYALRDEAQTMELASLAPAEFDAARQ